jgi:L-lactate dehydrogenase complex protein LldG
MTTAREEILKRIGVSGGFESSSVIPRDYRGPSGFGNCEHFAERLRDYQALVTMSSESQLPQALGNALERRGARRIVVPKGIPASWLRDCHVDFVADDESLSANDLDQVDGVLTTCAVAIAETGTIVLTHGPGQGRRALTLIPDYHLVIVEDRQVLKGVPDAVAALDPVLPMTWISGPSATSDIELKRVEGVHGPRNLEVVIVSRSS